MLKQIQPVAAYAAQHLDEDVSLDALAGLAQLSKFHLHRLFLAASGETPKQFTLRLRLARAAAMLLARRDSVLDIALACGFQSHEAFTRAFRRAFGTAPRTYRARGTAGRASAWSKHAELVNHIAPCIRFFHYQEQSRGQDKMAYSMGKKEIAEQPVLVVRRRIKPSEVAAALGAALGQVFQYAQQNGIALAGQPFTRYIEWGPGIWTIEAGLPVTSMPGKTSSKGDVRADVLPGGLAATTTHTGPYDKLNEAHAALQQWMEAEGLRSAGAPWEVYVTDPADHPDPENWKTDLFWPVEAVK